MNVAYPHRYTRLSRIWEDPPGWLTKVMILKFGSGGMLRGARTFFLAVIITEIAVVGVSTIVSFVTGVPTG